jgi:hypothetical protein
MESVLSIIFAHLSHLKVSGRGHGGRGWQLDAVVVVDNNLQTSFRLPLISSELTFKREKFKLFSLD